MELGINESAIILNVEAGDLEQKSRLLVSSIRRVDKSTHIYAIKPRKGQNINQKLLSYFDKNDVNFIDKSLNRKTSFYAFANKVYSSQYIEEQYGNHYDNLIFLDTDTLLLRPISELLQQIGPYKVAIKPSDNSLGLGSNSQKPPSVIWKWVYEVTGVDEDNIWSLADYRDGQEIRAYFNAGVIFKFGTNLFFNAWLENFKRITQDRRFFKLSGQELFFIEQMSFSATVLKEFDKTQIKLLDNSFNYPYNLHHTTLHQINSIERVKILHYHNEFNSKMWMHNLVFDSTTTNWLNEFLPFKQYTKTHFQRAREILLFQQYKLRYKYNLMR